MHGCLKGTTLGKGPIAVRGGTARQIGLGEVASGISANAGNEWLPDVT